MRRGLRRVSGAAATASFNTWNEVFGQMPQRVVDGMRREAQLPVRFVALQYALVALTLAPATIAVVMSLITPIPDLAVLGYLAVMGMVAVALKVAGAVGTGTATAILIGLMLLSAIVLVV